ncbi:MAG: hypothetical protein LAO21_17270 [Acidobacteriia bacterium]|nr:hypothetical protein [Terriglobia bacterium]
MMNERVAQLLVNDIMKSYWDSRDIHKSDDFVTTEKFVKNLSDLQLQLEFALYFLCGYEKKDISKFLRRNKTRVEREISRMQEMYLLLVRPRGNA